MDTSKDMAVLRRANLEAWMHKHRLSQTDVANRTNRSRSQISLLFKRFFGEKLARDMERDLGMPSGFLDDDTTSPKGVEAWATPDDLQLGVYALVPMVMLALSDGNLVKQEQAAPPLAFRQEWLKSKSVTAKHNLCVLAMTGDAMTPYLQDKDMLLIDVGQTDVNDNQIYAISYGGELRMKRLSRRFDGGLKIRSDNPSYPDDDLSPEQAGHIAIVGKLIWRAG